MKRDGTARISHRVPHLPTLTPDNRKTYPQWHAYFQRVYREPVSAPVDLNHFTWFYHCAPFDKPIRPRRQLPRKQWTSDTPSNGQWLGDIALSYMPRSAETKATWTLREGDAFQGMRMTVTKTNASILCAATLYGFFVRRNRSVLTDDQPTRVEVVRVRDAFPAQECIWYWAVRGSGVFVDVPAEQPLQVFPSSRREWPLYRQATTKAEFDKLDETELPTYLQSKQYASALFEVAHGIPELVISDNVVRNHARLLQIIIHEDPRTGKPMFVASPDMTSHNAVSGLPTRYLSTGLHQTIRGGSVSNEFRLIDYTLHKDPPIWYTQAQWTLVKLLVDDANTDEALRAFASQYDPKTFGEMANAWLPVHAYIPPPASHMPPTPFDGLVTPLGLAFVLRRVYALSVLVTSGATLSTPCPAQFRGDDDPEDLTVAGWLALWLHTSQTPPRSYEAVCNTIQMYAPPAEVTLCRTNGLFVLSYASPGSPKIHSKRLSKPSATKRKGHHKRRHSRRGGRVSQASRKSSSSRVPKRTVSTRNDAVSTLSKALVTDFERVYNVRRVNQNSWTFECTTRPFLQLPPLVLTEEEAHGHPIHATHPWTKALDGFKHLQSRVYNALRAPYFGVWSPTYRVAEYYTKWDVESNYHYNYYLRYNRVVGTLRHVLLGLPASQRALRYRFLRKQTPQELATRQFYQTTAQTTDLLIDYRGNVHTQLAIYKFARSGRLFYHLDIQRQLTRIHTLVPLKYERYEVSNHRPENESVKEFLLQQALIGTQVLAPGGTLLFTHVVPYLRPDVFQTLVCMASCFTRVRFVRHELELYVKVGCACVFEGFRGYTEGRVAQLWSYYTAIQECTYRPNQLFRVDALPSQTRTAYTQLATELAKVSLPSLRTTQAWLECMDTYRPQLMSDVYAYVRRKQAMLARTLLTKHVGIELPTFETRQGDEPALYLYLVDIPGSDLERQVLTPLFKYSDKRSSTLRKQVFRRQQRTIVVESIAYVTACEYPSAHPVWVLVTPPHTRFLRAFKAVTEATAGTRLSPIRDALRAHGALTPETFARLTFVTQKALVNNKALCSQLQYVCDTFLNIPVNAEMFASAHYLLDQLHTVLHLPAYTADGTFERPVDKVVTIHDFPVRQDWSHMTEEVSLCIDRLFDHEFNYLNREGRGWVRFSERVLHSKQLHVLSLHSGSRWSEWLLNEYLPLLSLLSAYKHVRPLEVYLYKRPGNTHYHSNYSELDAVLDQVRFHIQPFQKTPNLEYTALPSWSTLGGANALAVAPPLRRAVRYAVQLAAAYTTEEADRDKVSFETVRLQANARPLKPEIRHYLHRLDAENAHTQKVLLSTHTLFWQVAHLAQATRVLFLPGSEACMALFVQPDAHLVDIRRGRQTPGAGASADGTPQSYARWVADTDDSLSATVSATS